ncbi:MAG: hypothetical protein Q9219_005049 [cf. Caloplaca sp. 3 TL-2023]
MGNAPRPHFFIHRPDQSITPLVAVDELPDYIRITGVPAIMTQADTEAMMSLGVKERSLGQYNVQWVKSSDNSSRQGPVENGEASDRANYLSHLNEARPLEFPEGHNKQTDDNTADSSSIEIIQRPNLDIRKENVHTANNAAPDGFKDKKSKTVEEWRQDVEVEDEVQARIDNLIAANSHATDEVKKSLSDEDRQAARIKAGLIPGKKVYCSHWIRTGECGFVQQGCLYKHEMPEDDILKEIGIRVLPAWYVAAHPEKARERGYVKENVLSSFPMRSQPNSSPGALFPSPRRPSKTQPSPFTRTLTFNFPQKPEVAFLCPSTSFTQALARVPFTSSFQQRAPYHRFHELSDERVHTWHNGRPIHTGHLQLVPKMKSPGYNTCPYPFPATTQAPAAEKPQTNAGPVWEPRQSKYPSGSICRQEHSGLGQTRDVTAQESIKATSQVDQNKRHPSFADLPGPGREAPRAKTIDEESHDIGLSQSKAHRQTGAKSSNPRVRAVNAMYAPLEPSAPSIGPESENLPRQSRKVSNSSDLFALAPKVQSPAPRRFFATSGDRSGAAAKHPKASKADESGSSKPQENAKASSLQHQDPSEQHTERSKTALSPKKKQRAKRIEREDDGASERLVDF